MKLRELSEDAALLDEIAGGLTTLRAELDTSQQELLKRRALNLGSAAALLRSLGSFTRRKRIKHKGTC
jgi:hypothetical protein